jgi:hypothetical protein
MRNALKLKTFALLEAFFAGLEKWSSIKRERVALCQSCGRNRYSGHSCIVEWHSVTVNAFPQPTEKIIAGAYHRMKANGWHSVNGIIL